jgi:hypothetical protein
VTFNEILAELKLTDELLLDAPIDEQPASKAAMAATRLDLKALISELQALLIRSSFDPSDTLAASEFSQLPILRHELQLTADDESKRIHVVKKIVRIGRQALALPGTEDFPE